MSHNRYLPTDLSPNAALRLVTLPYAGGGTAMYYRWRSAMPRGVDVVPIALPGREARIGEQPITDLRRLVAEIADAIVPVMDRPFALMGHSMGAWLALELARELRKRDERLPCLLIVAASPAPHRSRSAEPLHNLPDAEFLAEMSRRFDGIPPAVRANAELLNLLLPAMRADMELLETYVYVDEPPLSIDLLAIGGTEDRAVSATDLADWRHHTTGRFSSRLLPGGHFFVFQNGDQEAHEPPAAVRVIARQLERFLGD
ncbi:MAG: alpha/beta fold hydrolase [Pirellulales bacterium]